MDPRLRRSVPRWTGAALALALAVFFALYANPQLAQVMEDPGHTFYSTGGDAWKNIYTFVYHVVNDRSAWLTQAYNYPDGEHIAFADAQPLLANLMRLAGVKYVSTAVTVVQLAPLLGVWFGAMLLTWLLVRLGLPLSLATLSGLGIALLSPQVSRVSGHFGLAYVFVLPALLHPLLSWSRRPNWRSIGYIVLLLPLFGQLHLYNLATGLAMSTVFIASYAALYGRELWRSVVAQLAVTAVGSFGLTQSVLLLVRPGIDRPSAPYGLSGAYNTRWEGLLFDKSLPWWTWIQEHVIKIGSTGGFEGDGYLGIVAGSFVLYWIFASLLRTPFGKTTFPDDLLPIDRKFVVCSVLAGSACLLLALGFPFAIDRLAWISDYVGPVRQFRTMGRFVWVFYYVAEVSTVVCLYALFSRKPGWHWFPYAAALVVIWEGTRNIGDVYAGPETDRHLTDYPSWDEAIGDPARYQAVLPIPYQHAGSENMSVELGGAGIFMNTILALRTGLPNMSVMMSRQGFTETVARLPIAYPWGTVPAVLENLPNDKPILLAVSQLDRKNWSEEGVDPDQYDPLISVADTIYADSRVVLARFYPTHENLARVTAAACAKALDTIRPSRIDSLPQGVAFYPLVGTSWQLPNSLDTASGLPLGARSTGTELVTLGSWDLPPGFSQGEYKLSAWLWTGADGYAGTQVTVDEVDPATGETRIWKEAVAIHDHRHHAGQWTLIDWELPIPESPSRIRIRAKPNRHPNVDAAYVRNLLIRPVDEHVAWRINPGLVVDNVLFDGCKR